MWGQVRASATPPRIAFNYATERQTPNIAAHIERQWIGKMAGTEESALIGLDFDFGPIVDLQHQHEEFVRHLARRLVALLQALGDGRLHDAMQRCRRIGVVRNAHAWGQDC